MNLGTVAFSLFFFLRETHLIPSVSKVNFGQDDTAGGAVDDFNVIRVHCQRQQFANHVDEKVLFHVDLDPLTHQRHYWSVVSRVTSTAAE